jgi:hypothetical protein
VICVVEIIREKMVFSINSEKKIEEGKGRAIKKRPSTKL